MNLIQKILFGLFDASAIYFLIAAVIVFLHCFYDSGFQWNKKKALILLACVLIIAFVDVFFIADEIKTVSDNLNSYMEDIQNEQYEDALTEVELLYSSSSDFLSTVMIGIYIIAAFVIALYDFKGNKARGFALALLALLVVMLYLTDISIILFNYIFNIGKESDVFGSEYIFGGSVTASILIILFCGTVFSYLYRRVYKQNAFMPCGKKENVSIFVFCIVCSVINAVISIYESFMSNGSLVPNREVDLPMVIMASCYALLMMIIPIFIYYTRIQGYYRERTKYQENFMEAELEHFMQFKQAQEETQRFRHDIRNDLLCMKEMLQSGKTEDAAKYLQDLLGVSDRLSAKYVTGDEMLDCIVSAKAGSMEQRGIRFRLDGVLAGGLGWKPMDICSVFANALDNAMEACMQLPEADREIELKIKGTPQFWFIRIENPVKEAVNTNLLFQEKGGYTTKENANQHGIGTYNMKHTVEANGGMLKAECTDLRFILEIMIDKNNF